MFALTVLVSVYYPVIEIHPAVTAARSLTGEQPFDMAVGYTATGKIRLSLMSILNIYSSAIECRIYVSYELDTGCERPVQFIKSPIVARVRL